MKYEKYLIKKDKLDLLSSLKALDKKLLNKKLKELGVDNIKELKEYIIDSFEMCLEMSKDDMFTQVYFQRLLENENTEWMSAYQDDIEGLWVFIYENKGHYSYYIPTEIKKIIKNVLYDTPIENDMLIENNMSYEEKFNLENAVNTPIIKDLKRLLNTLVIKDLRHIGELFLINRLSNKPKKELVNII